MTLFIRPPLWALSIRSPLWALLLILPMLAAGCSSSPERCGGEIQLSWAETKQLQQDVEVLASPRLQGRRSGTQGATLSVSTSRSALNRSAYSRSLRYFRPWPRL